MKRKTFELATNKSYSLTNELPDFLAGKFVVKQGRREWQPKSMDDVIDIVYEITAKQRVFVHDIAREFKDMSLIELILKYKKDTFFRLMSATGSPIFELRFDYDDVSFEKLKAFYEADKDCLSPNQQLMLATPALKRGVVDNNGKWFEVSLIFDLMTNTYDLMKRDGSHQGFPVTSFGATWRYGNSAD